MPFLSDFMDQFHQELISAAHDKPFQVATAGICIAAVSGLLLFGKRWDAVDYADVIAERVHRRNSVVHKSLKKDRVLIVDFSADASDIRQLYKEGRASVTDVVDQYCVQSFAVGRGKLTAVTEELYDEAHDAAVLLDNLSAAERESQLMNLPLWGIPISIKDCIQQRGTDATCGAAAKCSKPFSEDGLQVSLLRRAGAILHVRSNVPQLLMMPESENNVWGRTVNPWDAARTPGGSSGGEAALIAAGCSVMGLGSDIGGSIRIPAHYCGLVGLKPTPMRITTRGSVAPRYKHRNGQMIIKPVVGPIARSVRDCISMMEALTAPGVIDADPFLPPLQPWNTDLSITGPSNLKQPLKIGMMVTDDWFEAAEACQRAVRMAGNALQDQGFEVVEYKSKYSAWKMIALYLSILSADGNWYNHMKALEGEDLYESYKKTRQYTDLPTWLKKPSQYVLKLMGEYRKAHAVGTMTSGGMNVRDYWECIADMNEYMQGVTQEWKDLRLDGIIMPTTGLVATPHGMASDLIFHLSYTFYANILHVPAGTVPVTTVRKGEDNYDLANIPENQRDSVARLAHSAMMGSAGMPVGVQVVTGMWKDELCTYIMRCIEKGVNFNEICPALL